MGIHQIFFIMTDTDDFDQTVSAGCISVQDKTVPERSFLYIFVFLIHDRDSILTAWCNS